MSISLPSHWQQISLPTTYFPPNLIQNTVESFLFPPPHQRGQSKVSLVLVYNLGPKHVSHPKSAAIAIGSLASEVFAFLSMWSVSCASLSSWAFTYVKATVAPSWAKQWHTARPIPESPPVTSATFPCKTFSFVLLLVRMHAMLGWIPSQNVLYNIIQPEMNS